MTEDAFLAAVGAMGPDDIREVARAIRFAAASVAGEFATRRAVLEVGDVTRRARRSGRASAAEMTALSVLLDRADACGLSRHDNDVVCVARSACDVARASAVVDLCPGPLAQLLEPWARVCGDQWTGVHHPWRRPAMT